MIAEVSILQQLKALPSGQVMFFPRKDYPSMLSVARRIADLKGKDGRLYFSCKTPEGIFVARAT